MDIWSIPPIGVYKFNTNPSFDKQVGGITVVARDHDGVVVDLNIKYIPDAATVLALEAEALLLAMSVADKLKLEVVIFECDCC